ncbi:hypothetical protein ASE27_11570 [Oerskovia sp. Root918]|uniref:hypothetical protein n=1 Tax=unclassified Oerskovia TaxID=2619021 RepID=UPI0006FC9E81|nr:MULTISPECIES: hypothetical protein [unclassified Oerskovia]KRC35830.1 hypothetical protein ASE15_12265 [Oerskovia sp. Root22]KRD36245.1 hypothetical protein ASE27_11570 [Oerskovia sp. Root918]
MSGPSEPRPVGNVLWLALGSFVLAVLLVTTGAPVLPFLLLLLAVLFAVVGGTRYVRTRHTPRHHAPPRDAPPGRA